MLSHPRFRPDPDPINATHNSQTKVIILSGKSLTLKCKQNYKSNVFCARLENVLSGWNKSVCRTSDRSLLTSWLSPIQSLQFSKEIPLRLRCIDILNCLKKAVAVKNSISIDILIFFFRLWHLEQKRKTKILTKRSLKHMFYFLSLKRYTLQKQISSLWSL